MRLKGKTAVITGGASGIGKAIALRFAKEGANVAVFDLNEEAAKEIAKEIGDKAIAVGVNVASKQSIFDGADKVMEAFGDIDVWVNSAGISKILPFLECSEEIWNQTIDINLKGEFFGCQAAVTNMLKMRHGGSIINFSSLSGKKGTDQYQAYCSSKFGVIGLTQSVAMEFAKDNIRCNAVCPGIVQTPMWDLQIDDYARKRNITREEVMPRFKNGIPLDRLCTLEDVTNLIMFLATDDSSYMTGQSFNLTGGACMY